MVDETGAAVDGVEPWDDGGDSSICGILIQSMEEHHGESPDLESLAWEIRLHFEDGGIHGQENLDSITVEIHLRDDNILFPELQRYLGMTPLHYDLNLVPELLDTSDIIRFSGSVKVIDVRDGSDSEVWIIYNFQVLMQVDDYPGFIVPINMDGIDIRKLGGVVMRSGAEDPEPWDFSMVRYNFQQDIVIFHALNSLIQPGDQIRLDIDFEGNVTPTWDYGLWKQPCRAGEEKQCWFTQGEHAGARMYFPCLDEPRAKAVFDVKIARTEGWSTLFNTRLLATEPLPDREGWVLDTFETTPRMSTYLIALAITDFSSKGAASGTNVTIWAEEEYVEAGFADYAAVVGPQCIEATENTYGVPYTLDKMDMIHVRGFQSAMENWGLITYDFDYLLYDPSEPDPENDRKFAVLSTMAHELAHQWYGDLVTMYFWDQTWLNEGFATYVEHTVSNLVDPKIYAWDRFVAEVMFHVMKIDSQPDTWSLSGPVTSIDDVHRKFGLITYYKGASVIRMMESFLGLETLNKGLNSYLNDMAFNTAQEDDLFIHLEAAALEDGSWPQEGVSDFSTVMKTWTRQAGLPLVNVTRMGDGSAVISQTWYRDEVTEGAGDQIWSIPVTMTDGEAASQDWEDTKPDFWLTEASVEVSLPSASSVPILNKKASGFYRVTYDEDTWRAIGAILIRDHEAIHPYNR